MSSDTRSEGHEEHPIDPDADLASLPLGDDGEDADATVLARVPDKLLAELRGPESRGGQRATLPGGEGEESDALLAMLVNDARDERSAAPPRAAPPKGPPPIPARAAPPPPPPRALPAVEEVDAGDVGDETVVDLDDSGIDPETMALDGGEPEAHAHHAEEAEVAAAPHLEGEPEHEASGHEEQAPEASPAPARVLPSIIPPPVAFEREEDASALLIRMQQRDAWVERAEFLRGEAAALTDPAARAQALVVVSELLAMGGEEAPARAAAEEARTLAPSSPLAHRQVRGLLMREGDWQGALEALDGETRSSPTTEAKVHGTLLGAEIARLNLSDEEGSRKRAEAALRVSPADPRAHVRRLSDALAAAEEPGAPPPVSRIKLPELPELQPLSDALQNIFAHRGLTSATALGRTGAGKAQRPAGSTYEALLRIRASASATDHAGIVAGLEALAKDESLAGGAGWLAGVVAAPKKETRARSAEAFGARAGGTHGALARRALAARAIELGDASAAHAATADAGSDAFTPADRVALGTLSGGDRRDVEPWIDALLGDAELAPLGAAASAALGVESVPAVGSPQGRAATTLGRAVARAKEDPAAVRDAAQGFISAHEGAPIARALGLELDVEDHAGGKIARAVAEWRDDAEGVNERAIAGAIIAEAAGEDERARLELERVRAAEPANEAIARAAAAHAEDPVAVARTLAEHAQALKGDARAAVLLTEAALRLQAAQTEEEEGDGEADALLRRALEADPQIPLAAHLGERAARARGDRDGLVEWIRSRRETSRDPVEQAHDLVREALLISDGDAGAAAPLLEQALRARPGDVALREIFERLSPEPLPDRATWRVARAAEASGAEASRLMLEAALELERTGDLEGAARYAQKAVNAGDATLAPIAASRAALAGHGAADELEVLLERVRASQDPLERRELYERLADIDERGRGDAAGALVWRRTILEETPGHLPTLRRVATALISAGRDEELEPVALDIARALEGPESVAHAMLSARLRQRSKTWDDTREAVEIAYKHEPRGIWALRQMAAHGRAKGEHRLALEADSQLIERTQRPSEAATLSLRAAEAAVITNQIEDGLSFLGHAIELAPAHIVPHLSLALVLEKTGDHAGAAAALEAAANAAVSTSEKASALYRAAILWQDELKEVGKARPNLEAVAAIDPSYGDVFPRLQAIYVAEGARAELAALLEKRLDAVTDPAERVEMEVLRGRALADVGDSEAAKRALAAALEANPDHVEALAAFSDVAAAEEDWAGAEQAWIRLARLIPDTDRQAGIYLRLGELYDEHLPNPERAELAYQEILKRKPEDSAAREKLVALYQKLGDPAKAIEQQTLLINAAEAPEAKCERTTQLARIYEIAGDAKKAEATLLQARKTWPKDDVALASLARFYQRNNQGTAENQLLDRAVADARRALGTGRFEPYLFSSIATVAELRNRPDAAKIAHAAVAALDGGDASLDGAGMAAGDPELDELIAPEVMTAGFRELLRRTGPLLDTAIPFDLTAVRAAPLLPPQAELGELVKTIASGYGFDNIQVLGSSVLGSVCVAAGAHPPVVVLGHPLIASTNDEVKSFLIHRALKILSTNAAALSRTAPIDLWPLVAAYLKTFSPSWAPQGVDNNKLNDFHGRLAKALPKPVDPQLGALAAEIIAAIGNRASTLNTVINGWGNRAGLLATGDLNVAISGIAWAGGHTNAPPASGKERMTWIGRNAEARELVVFSVSDAHADARSRLGLSS